MLEKRIGKKTCEVFMDWLIKLFTNPFLVTSLASWFVAQVLKVIINAIVNKKLDFERLVGDGGMPSGHSATVVSLATMMALTYGPDSYQFAISAIMAIIVCHDAMGVRLETGKQAAVLNDIIESFSILAEEKLPGVKLEEFVGHTPIQVIAGSLIGLCNALIMYFFIL